MKIRYNDEKSALGAMLTHRTHAVADGFRKPRYRMCLDWKEADAEVKRWFAGLKPPATVRSVTFEPVPFGKGGPHEYLVSFSEK